MKTVFKRTPMLLCTLLFCILLLGHEARGLNASSTVTAKPTQQSVRLFATRDTDDFTPITLPLYDINGNNYAKLRDVAQVIDFGVIWDTTSSAIKVTTNNHYDGTQSTVGTSAVQNKAASLSQQPIYIDGKLVSTLTMYAIDGNNYIKLRDIAEAVNFGCRYDGINNAIMLCKESQYNPHDMWTTIRSIEYVEAGVGDSSPSTDTDSDNGNYTAEQAAIVAARRDFEISGVILMKSADTNTWTGLEGFDDFSFIGAPGVKSETGSISDVPIWLTKEDIKARKDYYSQASASVQTLVDRDAFNSACQSWEDRFLISENINLGNLGMAAGDGVLSNVTNINPFYRYACFTNSAASEVVAVSNAMRVMGGGGYPSIFSITNAYNALDKNLSFFSTGSIKTNSLTSTKKKDKNVQNVISNITEDMSDREKVTYMIKQVCDKLTYGSHPVGGYSNPWEKDGVVYGKCEKYQIAFSTLCYAYGIPALNIGGRNPTGSHAWNTVYLEDEGEWVVVDITLADGENPEPARGIIDEDYYYSEYHTVIANDPNSILIAKEIIAPGSSS